MALAARMIVGASGALVALMASGGLASAVPDVNAIVNSTCTYPQVMGALNAQDPAAANAFQANAFATAWLRQLIAAGPEARRQMIQQAEASPLAAQYSGLITQVTYTCNNF
ncbi:hemophore-related protein [Mycobacterium sp. OTB74]|jgi:hemophore-related protein|uniref:hemophore-related protein n=1 Tax=Mycobacterium sp. OTB74 TaxID=1853452 RepID=UPI0024755B16|nr:hemophore-related protein [Mycobacterium sp. OTB74]MDH6242681.1 hemophore-related protein [Mycobacterium sp. OTB74]